MTPQDINRDKFIENLIKKEGVEKVPSDFTKRIMEQVNPAPESSKDQLFSPLQWGLIASAVVAAIVTLFVLDVSFLNNIFSFDPSKINFDLSGRGFIESMNSFFESLKMSTVTFMSIAAILILLGLERLFRHGFGRANMNLF